MSLVPALHAALEKVIDPVSGQPIAQAGLLTYLAEEAGSVGVLLTITPETKEVRAPLREAVEAALSQVEGVREVRAVMTAHNPVPITNSKAHGGAARERAQWNQTPLPHVKRIIAVASGKGGVGKSTTTVNLAHALTNAGKRVGILDADIYGPSIPRMLGLMQQAQPEIVGGLMQPPTAHGIASMSMQYITGETAAILRGPMISKSLQQLLRMSAWGTEKNPLDILLVDLPPGTGDIHLSMAQQVPLSGAIIITTPQEVAVMDAQKSLSMFVKVGVPVLGVVENMSGFVDSTGVMQRIFGEGGGKALAERNHVPLLAEIPLNPLLREAADNGRIAATDAYAALALKLVNGE